jgi:hypothetical protein
MTSLTRGPLPAGVYWRRRMLLLATALVLVFGLARILGAGSDASSPTERVSPVAAVPSGTSTVTRSAGPVSAVRPHRDAPGAGATNDRKGEREKHVAPVLAAPSGPCADEDIAVTPTVPDPVAGRDVSLVLELRSIEAEACTWEVSADTLTLKITSGKDLIWATRQCPRAVPSRAVVVRRDVPTSVGVTWNARRSDEGCPKQTEWAMPGYYHVHVAALAGEPADEQFELARPAAEVVTRAPQPEKRRHRHRGGRPVTSPSSHSSAH